VLLTDFDDILSPLHRVFANVSNPAANTLRSFYFTPPNASHGILLGDGALHVIFGPSISAGKKTTAAT
jgi:hypothetical protein